MAAPVLAAFQALATSGTVQGQGSNSLEEDVLFTPNGTVAGEIIGPNGEPGNACDHRPMNLAVSIRACAVSGAPRYCLKAA